MEWINADIERILFGFLDGNFLISIVQTVCKQWQKVSRYAEQLHVVKEVVVKQDILAQLPYLMKAYLNFPHTSMIAVSHAKIIRLQLTYNSYQFDEDFEPVSLNLNLPDLQFLGLIGQSNPLLEVYNLRTSHVPNLVFLFVWNTTIHPLHLPLSLRYLEIHLQNHSFQDWYADLYDLSQHQHLTALSVIAASWGTLISPHIKFFSCVYSLSAEHDSFLFPNLVSWFVNVISLGPNEITWINKHLNTFLHLKTLYIQIRSFEEEVKDIVNPFLERDNIQCTICNLSNTNFSNAWHVRMPLFFDY